MVLHSRNSQKAKALFMLAALFCQRTNADVYRRVHTPKGQIYLHYGRKTALSYTHTFNLLPGCSLGCNSTLSLKLILTTKADRENTA